MYHNYKQEELAVALAKELEKRFPDIRFVDIAPSPEGDETLLLHFTRPDTDERFWEIGDYASERTIDILTEYGYHFVVMPVIENGIKENKAIASI